VNSLRFGFINEGVGLEGMCMGCYMWGLGLNI
jgi:hypothetical protein